MREPFLERRDRKLDLAAHAAWLYYIAGNTQEEVAVKLNQSNEFANVAKVARRWNAARGPDGCG